MNEQVELKSIYIDTDYKCYTEQANGRREYQLACFAGKCKEFIEGHRYIPFGDSWTRSDGFVFHGEMVAPWKPFDELDQAQRQYEQELAEAARILLGEVNV